MDIHYLNLSVSALTTFSPYCHHNIFHKIPYHDNLIKCELYSA